MCDAAAILKLSLIMFSLGPTFRIRAPTVALDNSEAKGTKSTSFLTCVRNEVDLEPLACEDGLNMIVQVSLLR